MLLQQRRGKGSTAFRAPSHRYKTELSFRPYDDAEKSGTLHGEVIAFVDDPARSAPLMKVLFENGEAHLYLAPESARIGDALECGIAAAVAPGNVLPLAQIPDGMPLYSIEITPGDGGKLVRSAGSCAYIVSHENNTVTVRLPSKQIRAFDARCRAQVGVVSGGGIKDKPFVKAGKHYHATKARNLRWPIVRGVAMNPYNHPFGGKEHHKGKSSMVSRHTPPGRKVGHIAARRVGRRAGKAQEEQGTGR